MFARGCVYVYMIVIKAAKKVKKVEATVLQHASLALGHSRTSGHTWTHVCITADCMHVVCDRVSRALMVDVDISTSVNSMLISISIRTYKSNEANKSDTMPSQKHWPPDELHPPPPLTLTLSYHTVLLDRVPCHLKGRDTLLSLIPLLCQAFEGDGRTF